MPPADALLMTNILASRAEEWELLRRNFERIRPTRSSVIVDLWNTPMTPADAWADHGSVLSLFEQVLFLKIGRRDGMERHMRPNLTYYRHWIACLEMVAEEELPTHIIQMDARYEDALDLDFAFNQLRRSDVFAVTCYQDRRKLSARQIMRMAKGEAREHGLSHKIVSKEAGGFRVLGPWFSTRYFAIHRDRLAAFLGRVRTWPPASHLRLEYHLCGLLSERTALLVHDPV